MAQIIQIAHGLLRERLKGEPLKDGELFFNSKHIYTFSRSDYVWHQTNEELPDEGKLVVIHTENNKYLEAKRYGHGWERTVDGSIINVCDHVIEWAEMKGSSND